LAQNLYAGYSWVEFFPMMERTGNLTGPAASANRHIKNRHSFLFFQGMLISKVTIKGRQDLSISNFYQGVIISGRRFILQCQLAQGNLEGVRYALHAAEGRVHLSRCDLAQKAEGTPGHFGHSGQSQPFLFPQSPELFPQFLRMNLHRPARTKFFITNKIIFSICQEEISGFEQLYPSVLS
jgi:hypothetical protein